MTLGRSDATASWPTDRPVSPTELTATCLAWFGIDGKALTVPVGRQELPLVPADPLRELWS
jgi:hypothetical protein